MNNEEDKISELTKPSCESQNVDRFLDLLEKDIEQHPNKLIVPSQEMKEQLDDTVGEYSVDLDGDY
ncbi:hypothetical protein C1S86_14840 [Vibrio parahaemolyticus]|uniref:hypothetical protein n=1 Tax=Vibrio TaxID=662 RepID=UPI00099489B9|nr:MULTISPECIES: hypothetical protein [Vibrio]HDZ3712489.1 hypothetical protein [Vibrio vulnificus]EGR1578394.1 hypothetical protein [Vibrio parahaemolyticus]OOQ68969.1 hypothetical protein BSR61_16030 [Vibrio parahaemolyticus]PMT75642.1 hypothetical protein C1S97_16700 [Vibrio parahaemolyticus]PMT81071.1 hypothetical protein C1S86_14840 [Vibrio parahaemolyticus]